MTAHDSALDPAEPQPAAQPHVPSPSQASETASDPATVEAAPSSPERASTPQADAPEAPTGRSTAEAQVAAGAPVAPASDREPGGEPSALASGAPSEQTPTPGGEQRTEEVLVPRPAPGRGRLLRRGTGRSCASTVDRPVGASGASACGVDARSGDDGAASTVAGSLAVSEACEGEGT